jgi:S-DNA-T family DNA segregation ATPase FtsK/SpoIIIE
MSELLKTALTVTRSVEPSSHLVSAEGFNHPRRARAYLVTDDNVQATVERYASDRPALDTLSTDALDNDQDSADVIDAEIIDDTDPEQALWDALLNAPDAGLSVPELMQLTGMRRTWIYDRLQAHPSGDRATQVSRGRWRATDARRHDAG